MRQDWSALSDTKKEEYKASGLCLRGYPLSMIEGTPAIDLVTRLQFKTINSPIPLTRPPSTHTRARTPPQKKAKAQMEKGEKA